MNNYRKGYHGSGRLHEKRKFYRIKMIIGWRCHRKKKKKINIFTDDISKAGIRFFCQQPMKNKEEVTIEFPVSPGKIIPIDGRVAWIRKKENGSYEGGVEFSPMDAESLRLWIKFIKRNCELGDGINI